MKRLVPIGIVVFAWLGIAQAIGYWIMGAGYFVLRKPFGVADGTDSRFYILASIVAFATGFCLCWASLGLLCRRLWARRWFLVGVAVNVAVEVLFFTRDVARNMHRGLFPVERGSAAGLGIICLLSVACFWFLMRDNVRDYLRGETASR